MCRTRLLAEIESHKNRYPQKIIFSDKDTSLTWSKFYSYALNLSYALASSGKEFVPVIVNRSVYTPCIFLACIIARKVFIPISNKQPISRILDILSQVEHDIIVDFSDDTKAGNNTNAKLIDLKEFFKLISKATDSDTLIDIPTSEYDNESRLLYILSRQDQLKPKA